MGEPRKIFRIEEIAATRRTVSAEDASAIPGYTEIMRELSALRALIIPSPPSAAADGPQRAGVERLASALALVHDVLRGTQHEHSRHHDQAPMTRIAHELEAVSKGSEEATQKILAAAEDIDQAADNLAAALKDEIDCGLAQDIRDRVVQIFEACQFPGPHQPTRCQGYDRAQGGRGGDRARPRSDRAATRRASGARTAPRK